MTECRACGEPLGYDPVWDEPPKGDGHIEVVRNPANEPSYVVQQTDYYCSHECYMDSKQ